MMRIASEFGFTPASRSRISTPSERATLFTHTRYVRKKVLLTRLSTHRLK